MEETLGSEQPTGISLEVMLTRIARTGERAGRADLLNHEETSVLFNNALRLCVLVACMDGEAGAIGSHPLVLNRSDLERLGALLIAALADEQIHPHAEPLARELRNTLVHFAEDSLVPRVLFVNGANYAPLAGVSGETIHEELDT